MSNQITVDSFVIEMSLQETVLKGLTRLEKQILPVAKRIEANLDQVFSKNRAKLAEPAFKALEKRAALAGRNINKALTDSFHIRGADTGLFTRYQREGQNAAREVGRAIRDAYRVRSSINPPLPPLPRPGQPRSRANPRQVIEDIHQRQLTSGFYGQMQLRDSNRAAEYRSRLERLRMEHTASQDMRGFRNSIRALNYEFAQGQRLASQQRASARLQALEASNAGAGLSRLTDGATGLIGGFFALNRALSSLQETITIGGKYQQAHTMGVVAYGDEAENQRMTQKADSVSRAYGLDPLQTREQMAQLRMTMPDNFKNDQIAELFENESVFAHTTGMDPQAVGRLNYAFQQIATSAHLMGQDFLQVVNASPALIRGLQKLHGFTNSSQLKEYYKTVPGSAFVSDSLKVMKPTEQQKTMAQENIIAAQGRLAGSIQFAQRDFYDNMSKPMVRFFKTLTDSADNLGSTLTPVAKAVGYFADRLSDIGENANVAAQNLSGYSSLASEHWSDFYSNLDKDTQSNLQKLSGVFNEWFDVLIAVVAGKLALAGISKFGKMTGIGTGEMMGAAGRTFGVAAAVVMGKELGDLLFDKFIPQFQKFAHDKWGWGGKDGTETTHGGNVIKDSALDKILNFFGDNAKFAGAQFQQVTYPSLLNPSQYLPQAQPIVMKQEPLQILPFRIDIPMPNGETYSQMITPIVQQQIASQHELQMMSATGLAGGWQSPGDNAGWNPSLLKRK
ncbi:hypothetical protein MHZ90_14365 [Pantoea sp. ACRSH]|uniref:hypothetical protein n=1 Tax=unclassified Pantoea TaxID=2630326 RepID=UPI001EF46209|nr:MULTISPECIES: hypothetical protein [unclassified Pantoea]MCG7367305.1 hypothetical protein [Pantoea sp. ACRSH]MCG7397598.1 hypothetical protein [Pantoea sp. ACRSC]